MHNRQTDPIEDMLAFEGISGVDGFPHNARSSEIAVPSRREPIFTLAAQYGLSAYDATYLELALRTGAALITFDKKLNAARGAAGIPSY
jgi:hypothetical protein